LFSAVTSPVGWWPCGKARNLPSDSSPRVAKSKASNRVSSPYMLPRYVDELQARRLFTGGSWRNQDTQSSARLQRQPLLGKPIPHAEVSSGVPGSLRLHSGQSGFLSGIFSMVQRRTPPLGPRPTHASDAPLQANGPGSRTAPTRAQCRLPTSSGALRAKRPKTAGRPHGGLDQQTSPAHMKKLTKFRENVSQGH